MHKRDQHLSPGKNGRSQPANRVSRPNICALTDKGVAPEGVVCCFASLARPAVAYGDFRERVTRTTGNPLSSVTRPNTSALLPAMPVTVL